jgi:hypothetical protein
MKIDLLETGIIFVVTITIVVIICHIIYTNYYTLYPEVGWNNDSIIHDEKEMYLPKDALMYEIKHRGLPTKLDRSFQGYAIWSDIDLRKHGFPYSKIVIRDKSQVVDKPYHHIPHLEYYIKVSTKDDIHQDIIVKLISMTSLLGFNTNTQELVARSDSSSVNQHILGITSKLFRQVISQEEAKKEIEYLEKNINAVKIDTTKGSSYEQELYF